MKRLNGFFRYFGAKREAARNYPTPRYAKIIEPFAGSAGFSVEHFIRKVDLYDISDYICGVWDFLINATPLDILHIPVIGEFEDVSDLKASQEIKWFIGYWLQIGSNCKPATKASKWGKQDTRGRLESRWDERNCLRIAQQVQYIKHWTITKKSYREIPDEPATWFVDPPYHLSGHRYPGGKEIDYDHLASWCRTRTGQVIVCEETGADWLPFQAVKARAGLSNKTNREVVYYQ